MQKIDATSTRPSPFFELLADADEIKIREVPPEGQTGTENTDGAERTFFVRIRTKPATPPPSPSAAEPGPLGNRLYLLKSAELLIADRDFVLARNIYSYLLKSDIRDPEALRGLGICFSRLGELTSAKKCFRALFEISNREDCLLFLGQCYAAEGEDVKAIEHFQRVTEPQRLAPSERFDLFRELGNCLTRRGCFDEAWSAYHRALEQQPSSDTLHVNLGTLEIQRNHPDVALSYFSKAVQLNPNNSRAHCGLGLVAIAKEDLATAGRELVTALDLDSQNLVALLQLVSLSGKTGAYPLVLERLETFLNKDSKNIDVRYALGVILYKAGEWSRCAVELEALLRIAPDHAKAKILREELNSNKPTPK